uniref:Cytochrome n=1 Tax=Lutzomyia longipalpis TaxID=7200 RepID=A0A1B0GJT7_LUTLO
MAMFPEYQERIFEEIKTTLPNLQDYVEYEDLNKCDVLDRFIKETLRLFPSLPLIVRSVEKATKIVHKWKQSRKTLNPVFSTKACQGYLTIFNEEINVMVSRMKDICRNHKPVDIQYYISALIIDEAKAKWLENREELKNQGGYETSTVTSLFCILAMAMFPEYQERIFEEIKTTLPNLQDYVEYEDLNKCEFLDRFIKETLRLFPSLPLIVRSVEKATQI